MVRTFKIETVDLKCTVEDEQVAGIVQTLITTHGYPFKIVVTDTDYVEPIVEPVEPVIQEETASLEPELEPEEAEAIEKEPVSEELEEEQEELEPETTEEPAIFPGFLAEIPEEEPKPKPEPVKAKRKRKK